MRVIYISEVYLIESFIFFNLKSHDSNRTITGKDTTTP